MARPEHSEQARGFALSVATVWRYLREAVDLLANCADDLTAATRRPIGTRSPLTTTPRPIRHRPSRLLDRYSFRLSLRENSLLRSLPLSRLNLLAPALPLIALRTAHVRPLLGQGTAVFSGDVATVAPAHERDRKDPERDDMQFAL